MLKSSKIHQIRKEKARRHARAWFLFYFSTGSWTDLNIGRQLTTLFFYAITMKNTKEIAWWPTIIIHSISIMIHFITCLIIFFIEIVFVFKKQIYLLPKTNMLAKQQNCRLLNAKRLLMYYYYLKLKYIEGSPCLNAMISKGGNRFIF